MSKRGKLRASDSDRDQVIDRLHRASTEGRIAAEELEERVSRALKARTYDELDATVSDLPHPSGRTPARSGVGVMTGRWMLSTVRANPILLLLAIPVLAVTAAVLVAATITWLVLMFVFMVLTGRRTMPRGPWTYAWHSSSHRYPPARYSAAGKRVSDRMARRYGPRRQGSWRLAGLSAARPAQAPDHGLHLEGAAADGPAV